jgi:hypothetical protein
MIAHRIPLILAGLLVSCASLLLTPCLAAGQNAVLYEVTEQMKVKRRDTVRVATAALMGSLGEDTSLCPDWLVTALQVPRCSIAATATDRIDLSTGQGPVSARFFVLIPGDNPVDGSELVIAEGSLHGTIDLSPAVVGIDGVLVPLGALTAVWSARGSRGGPLDGLRTEGTVTGTFRLPFVAPGLGVAYLIDPSTGAAVAVRNDELSLGVPTVRLELNFVEGRLRR